MQPGCIDDFLWVGAAHQCIGDKIPQLPHSHL